MFESARHMGRSWVGVRDIQCVPSAEYNFIYDFGCSTSLLYGARLR